MVHDVLIAGGGPVGASLALDLVQRGIQVQILEARSPLGKPKVGLDPRTLALNAGSIAYLQKLGIWSFLADKASAIQRIIVAEKGSQAATHFQAKTANDPMGVIVTSDALQRALDAALAARDVKIHYNTPLNNIEWTSGCAVAEGITTPLLIAADGRGSKAAAAAGLYPEVYDYGQKALVTVLSHPNPHHNTAVELFTPQGPVALLPMVGNFSALVWTDTPLRAQSFAALEKTWFEEALHRAVGESFLGRLVLETERLLYPLQRRVLPRLTTTRFAAVGDAGHRLHPLAGQGLNLGLRDAAALASIVAEAMHLGMDPGSEEVLRRYEHRRVADIALMSTATHGINAVFSSHYAVVRAGRRVALRVVNALPPLGRLLTSHAMGDSIVARRSVQ